MSLWTQHPSNNTAMPHSTYTHVYIHAHITSKINQSTCLVVEVLVVVVVEDGRLLRVLHEALHRVPVRASVSVYMIDKIDKVMSE